MKSILEMLAGYNRWANRRLYAAAAELGDADYRADHGAFFGSVHGTLNHLLAGDRIWMWRLTGQGDVPARLDQILYESLDDLRAAREAEDERIVSYVAALADGAFAGTVRYRTITGPADIEQELLPVLINFFNHQTHHRGQAHALVSGILGNDRTPSFDLIIYQRETGEGTLRTIG
jgi:uncharacterized damage-inducible protein DinB